MKKVLLYFMLFLIAAEATEVDQLAKLPILFQHFAEHQERDKSVSLMQFLSMHYGGNDQDDNDNDRDEALPFKKLDAHHSTVLMMPTVRTIAVNTYGQPVNINLTDYSPGHIPDAALSSHFRPPRV
ncbi:hypothetical protein [Mucilaginibacter myungsuensis]|uniref:Uncharacterized protein n=1 Tax=Mucilaginibacter myungsuensis TaxID=649104 RepID=A0A929L3P8_9SPHI|nr:hypothetical protein [Mucilaginibacter myungsuensis]MBE9662656.1 hypothetical protein [Mucilaginibacter myungsuensis]MDN3598076.1 hypothetical protein [Mucilaginibacter myungsuensis]